MSNKSYKVVNNESGKITWFDNMQEAIEYQEKLVFYCGVDAEVI